jgi:hypothetical protein
MELEDIVWDCDLDVSGSEYGTIAGSCEQDSASQEFYIS